MKDKLQRRINARGPITDEGKRMMARTRAAVAFINGGCHDSEGLKAEAFMAIFHPDVSDKVRRAVVDDARARDRRR